VKAKSSTYPLYYQYRLCPNPKYVGGKFVYICGCKDPANCPGVKATKTKKDTQK